MVDDRHLMRCGIVVRVIVVIASLSMFVWFLRYFEAFSNASHGNVKLAFFRDVAVLGGSLLGVINCISLAFAMRQTSAWVRALACLGVASACGFTLIWMTDISITVRLYLSATELEAFAAEDRRADVAHIAAPSRRCGLFMVQRLDHLPNGGTVFITEAVGDFEYGFVRSGDDRRLVDDSLVVFGKWSRVRQFRH